MSDVNSTQKSIQVAQEGLDKISEKLKQIHGQLVDIKQITNSFCRDNGSKANL
jgi:hypothetical protein